MKRNIVLLLALLLAFGGWLLAREKIILKVKVQTANVRSAPDAAAAVVAKATSGTLLEATGREGAWYGVKVNNAEGKEITGYVHNSVVDVLSGGEEEEAPSPPPDARRQAPAMRPPKAYAAGGVKLMGGLSLGNLNVSEAIPSTVKKTSKMGFMGGLGYESGGQIAVEFDLLYSPGGTVIKATDPASKGKATVSGTAITMPVLLKVRFLRGMTPYILAGGEIGYVLKTKIQLVDNSGVVTGDEDVTDEFKRLVYGVVFGGGLEMRAGGMSLLLEARYRLGLSNMIKEPDPGDYMKPTALTFTLAVKF
jgi:opacity protein-like surface antigen